MLRCLFCAECLKKGSVQSAQLLSFYKHSVMSPRDSGTCSNFQILKSESDNKYLKMETLKYTFIQQEPVIRESCALHNEKEVYWQVYTLCVIDN